METTNMGDLSKMDPGNVANAVNPTSATAITDTGTTPTSRIDELLADMGPQKKQLLAIMDFCREERTSAEIDQMLDAFPEQRASVYSGITMRSLLEKAGGLLYFPNDSNPAEMHDENGDLILPEPSVATWRTTNAGIECVDVQDPYRDLTDVLGKAKYPAEGFSLVLSLCLESNRSISSITEALANSEIAQDAEYDATAYVSALEDAGALEWRGSWAITDLGKRYLQEHAG